MVLFKQKLLWIGVVIVIAVLVIFGAAVMGSVLGTKPKELPVALVVLDQPAPLPGGEPLAVGEMIKEKLTANTELPLSWTIVGSEEEARRGLNDLDYYGALILPADLSAGTLSLAGPSPKPAAVRILVNEGMNTQASTVVKQILEQAMSAVGKQLAGNMLDQLGQQSGQGTVPLASAQALLNPIEVKTETLHPIGVNNANGNAPGLLTQIIWISSLVTAMLLFLASGNAMRAGASRFALKPLQAAAGIVITGLASGFLVWMASSWYGMELAHSTDVWLFLWLSGSSFFLLQSSLLNWIGFPAMAILILLMFFSMPVLNIAPEFMSEATQAWLYSWTPLKFAAAGLREIMYFGGLEAVGASAIALWSIAGAFLLVLLASAVKKEKKTLSQPAHP